MPSAGVLSARNASAPGTEDAVARPGYSQRDDRTRRDNLRAPGTRSDRIRIIIYIIVFFFYFPPSFAGRTPPTPRVQGLPQSPGTAERFHV